MTRVQVVVKSEEREAFRQQAESEGLTLSAWFREAARQRLASRQASSRITSSQELEDFFAACDQREVGQEPDWDDHLKVIAGSLSSGRANE